MENHNKPTLKMEELKVEGENISQKVKIKDDNNTNKSTHKCANKRSSKKRKRKKSVESCDQENIPDNSLTSTQDTSFTTENIAGMCKTRISINITTPTKAKQAKQEALASPVLSTVRVMRTPGGLFPMFCEWDDCTSSFHCVKKFMDHMHNHLHSEFDTRKTEQGVPKPIGEIVCLWRECGHETGHSFVDLVRHAYYHVFHAKLKNLGQNIIHVQKHEPCSMNNVGRNVIPDLPDRMFCGWKDCELFFDNPETFYRHVNCHDEHFPAGNIVKGVFCEWDQCNTTFKSKHKLREHLRSHTQEKVVACPTCGIIYANNTKFVDHLKRQLNDRDRHFQCSHCVKHFCSERLLRDHMRFHVNHVKCPHCDMTTTGRAQLALHIKHRHTNSRDHHCSQCKAAFVTQSDLRKHEEVHVAGCQYACQVEGCEYKSRTYTGLSRHFTVKHQGANPHRYACHLCDKRFRCGAVLTGHLKEEHSFRWPPGHKRFRYKLGNGGLYQLQQIRYESIDLTEQMLTDKLSSPGVSSTQEAQNQPASSEETEVKSEDGRTFGPDMPDLESMVTSSATKTLSEESKTVIEWSSQPIATVGADSRASVDILQDSDLVQYKPIKDIQLTMSTEVKSVIIDLGTGKLEYS